MRPTRYITTTAAAEVLGTTPAEVDHLSASGVLEAVETVDGRQYVSLDSLRLYELLVTA